MKMIFEDADNLLRRQLN